MLLALAQINPTIGDLSGNSNRIVDYTRRAAESGAELVIFPEMCVTGYPPLDLLDLDAFIDATERAVDWIAGEVPRDVGVILGAPARNSNPDGKRLFNTAFLLENGREAARVEKMLLPTYDIFDEYRYFEPAMKQDVIRFRGLRLGVHICEDMWNNDEYAEYHTYSRDPLKELADQGVDLFVNLSSSPFSSGKHILRTEIIEDICERFHVAFVVVNQVGANTDVIFDGDSRVHGADGRMLACARSFHEDLVLFDTGSTDPSGKLHPEPVRDRTAELHDALVLGISDYYHKTGAFARALVGLSGGIDSAVTCALAVEALGPESVVGITLPSQYSSAGSVGDSRALAENLGIEFDTISIRPAVTAFSEMLEPTFRNTAPGVAEENIQARVRGVSLMAISNKFNYLLLTTGNKSELSMGYATLYGDMSGGLAVLSDVFKTQVFDLARHINARANREIIPNATITKPPSAELAPDQKDEDTLPPYPVLDSILEHYIELRHDVERIIAETGFGRDLVCHILRTVDRNEYKRRQAPPGLRISSKAFGYGRRQPVVMRFDRAEITRLFSDPVSP